MAGSELARQHQQGGCVAAAVQVLLLRGPTAAAGIALRFRSNLHHFELFCKRMGCYILLTSLLHVAAAAPCCPLLAVPFRRPPTRQAKPYASSPTSSVCTLACVDPFTHAHAIDPCPLPSTAVAGTSRVPVPGRSCSVGSASTQGHAHSQPFHKAVCCP
jgi:hypothetical protein